MTAILHNNKKIICPHCNCTQENYAKDYVVYGHIGHSSKCEELCWNCDGLFTAERLNADEIRIIFE